MSPSHTRRVFLQRGLTLVSAALTVPTFLDSTVWALNNPLDMKRTQSESGTDGRILVVLQMSGGNDGLSSVIPYADDAYHRARPTIGRNPNEVLKLTDYIGLDKNMTAMKGLYDAGMMSVIQGVGYPNPNRSHFRAMDIWQTAEPTVQNVADGWLGRYFDNTCNGEDPHAGICIGDSANPAMKGSKTMPLSFDKPDSYRYKGNDTRHYAELNKEFDTPQASVIGGNSAHPPIITAGSQLEFLTRTAMDAQVSSDKILNIVKGYQTQANYPRSSFGEGLRTVAAMIRGGLPTRVYYVSMGGFDTHAAQNGRHDRLMQELSQGIGAFWKDIKDQKNEQRVAMMCFSEFGRRVQENASGGTDHGAAAPMFLFGPAFAKRAGVVGPHPSLTNLDEGDLRFNIDFRSVYATILEEWLQTPSKPVLGQQFKTMPIFT